MSNEIEGLSMEEKSVSTPKRENGQTGLPDGALGQFPSLDVLLKVSVPCRSFLSNFELGRM